MSFSQGGTIRVNKNLHQAEIYGLSSNRIGQPQSFIILFDRNKAVFINTYHDANYILENYFEGNLSNAKIFSGMFKMNNSGIFIYLTKGLAFKGSKINDALYLRDNSNSEVLFYKIYN